MTKPTKIKIMPGLKRLIKAIEECPRTAEELRKKSEREQLERDRLN